MLATLYLQRFKKFEQVEVHLRPFTVLMGENSSGKTTILQAANLALTILATRSLVITRPGAVEVKGKGVGLTSLPGISLSDFRELYYGKISRGGTKRGAGGAVIELLDDAGNRYKLQLTSLFGGFNIKCVSTGEDLAHDPHLHEKPPLYISGFVGLRAQEERMFPIAMRDRLRFGQASQIIRNLILDIKDNAPDRFDMLKKKLTNDFDFHLSDEILFDEDEDLTVTAHYRDLCGNSQVSLDFNASGSGFMQLLQILAPIYRFCPEYSTVVLLDEPDAHLHPNLQASLASALRDIQREFGIQIIISTHSTSIIRAASPSEVVPISVTASVSRPLAKALEVEDQITSRIDSYDLGKSVLSGKLIFIEDQNTAILEMCDKVLGTRVFAGHNTVPVLRGRGKDDKVPYQIKPVFNQFVGGDIEVHFIRDGDSLNDTWRTKLQEFARGKSVVLHHLDRHEIENYVLIPSMIRRAILNSNPSAHDRAPSEDEIKAKMLQALKDTLSMAKFRFDDTLEDAIYKAGLLTNSQEYRNPQVSKSEAIELRESYEKPENATEANLLRVGMGKQVLSALLDWVNRELKLQLSKAEVVGAMQEGDVHAEIKEILQKLKSKEARTPPGKLPVIQGEEENDLRGPSPQQASDGSLKTLFTEE